MIFNSYGIEFSNLTRKIPSCADVRYAIYTVSFTSIRWGNVDTKSPKIKV